MIKNLIFDVGNVLIGYRWLDMLLDHGLDRAEAKRIGSEMFDGCIWWDQMDSGAMDIEGAILEYGKLFPEDIQVIAWFLHNGEQMAVPRPEVWEKVARLKENGFRIYILSNYSRELFEKHTRNASFLKLLDGGIVSCQVHITKPDKRIYQTLLERYGLKAEECIFFDDREENVEAARAQGIRAVQVLSREMINQTLEKICRNPAEELQQLGL